MSNAKNIQEDDILRYAQEQFEYHTQKAKQWELVINATNKTTAGSSAIITNISMSASEKNKNLTLLKTLNEAFYKYDTLKTAKQWYDILKDDIGIAFPTFYANLRVYIEYKDIANIVVPKAQNHIKFWFGSKNWLDDNGNLKSEYKLKLEQCMINERRKVVPKQSSLL